MASDGTKMNVRLDFKWNIAKAENLRKNQRKAQAIYDNEVLKHISPYVPHDIGTLEESATIASHIGEGELIWDTPYARRVYYQTGRDNGLRGKFWGERAKKDKQKTFEKVARAVIKKAGDDTLP